MDICFELATQITARLDDAVSTADEVHGFRYFDNRDLLGFVDGTENPVGGDAEDATVIGAEDAAFAGGSPVVELAGLPIGFGGLLNFLRITTLSIVLLGLGAMVSWTTNVAEIAPAVATLGRPLRLLRVPVDEWAVTIALALRAFPMLIDEFRVLYAARRLRPKRVADTRRARRRRWALEVVDLITTALTVTLRRADEMGDAITARGGIGQISALPSRPKQADWIALGITVAVCAAAVALEIPLGH